MDILTTTLKNMATASQSITQRVADIDKNAKAISECAASQDTSEETVNNKLKLLAEQLSDLKDDIKYMEALTYCVNRDVNGKITPFFRQKAEAKAKGKK